MHLSRSPYVDERDIKGGEITIFCRFYLFKKGNRIIPLPFFNDIGKIKKNIINNCKL
jgi:hypothetical protein